MHDRIKTALISLALLVVLAHCARAYVHWNSAHYNVSAEANNLSGILRFADGKTLYPAPQPGESLQVYLYPPFHAWLLKPYLSLFSANTLSARVLAIRTSSLIFSLVLFILTFVFLRQHGCIDWGIGLISLAMIGIKFSDYVTTARNDTLGLLLEVSAALLFIRWIKTQNRFSFLASWLLCILSIFTRSTGGMVLLAIGFYLLKQKFYSRALVLIGVTAITIAALIVSINTATHGLFASHVLFGNLVGWRPFDERFWDPGVKLLLLCYSLPIGATIIALCREKKDSLAASDLFLRILFFTSGIGGSALLLRQWSDINYLLLFFWITGAYFYRTLVRSMQKQSAQGSWFAWLCGIQLMVTLSLQGSRLYSISKVVHLPFDSVGTELATATDRHALYLGDLSDSLILRSPVEPLFGVTVGETEFAKHSTIGEAQRKLLKKYLESPRQTIVFADRNALEKPLSDRKGFEHAKLQKCLDAWVCVYEIRSNRLCGPSCGIAYGRP